MANKVLDPISNAQDRRLIGQSLDQSRKDVEFLNAHWSVWVDQYPDKWVAIYGEEMVGMGDTFDEAIQAAENKGTPRSRVIVEYLAKDPIAMILPGALC